MVLECNGAYSLLATLSPNTNSGACLPVPPKPQQFGMFASTHVALALVLSRIRLHDSQALRCVTNRYTAVVDLIFQFYRACLMRFGRLAALLVLFCRCAVAVLSPRSRRFPRVSSLFPVHIHYSDSVFVFGVNLVTLCTLDVHRLYLVGGTWGITERTHGSSDSY